MGKKRLLWREEKGFQILSEHPWWSNNRVGQEMVRLGICKDRGYLNKRIWKEQHPEGKKVISEPWCQMMLRKHKDDVETWNKYYRNSDSEPGGIFEDKPKDSN
ncbi:unnamed protein product, partial [marine sediment metagenome]